MSRMGLPLHAEKAVTGRLLGFEVLAPSLSWLESLGHRDAGARLRERLCWFTNEALDYPDDCESLSLFLANLVGELEAEAAKLPTEAREAAACVLTELAALVTAFAAAPYDPLERLLAAVAQTAADYYESSNSVVPLAVWQCTHPVVSFLGGKVELRSRLEFTFRRERNLESRGSHRLKSSSRYALDGWMRKRSPLCRVRCSMSTSRMSRKVPI